MVRQCADGLDFEDKVDLGRRGTRVDIEGVLRRDWVAIDSGLYPDFVSSRFVVDWAAVARASRKEAAGFVELVPVYIHPLVIEALEPFDWLAVSTVEDSFLVDVEDIHIQGHWVTVFMRQVRSPADNGVKIDFDVHGLLPFFRWLDCDTRNSAHQ